MCGYGFDLRIFNIMNNLRTYAYSSSNRRVSDVSKKENDDKDAPGKSFLLKDSDVAPVTSGVRHRKPATG